MAKALGLGKGPNIKPGGGLTTNVSTGPKAPSTKAKPGQHKPSMVTGPFGGKKSA